MVPSSTEKRFVILEASYKLLDISNREVHVAKNMSSECHTSWAGKGALYVTAACSQKGEAEALAEGGRVTWDAKTKPKVSDWGCWQCVSPLEAVSMGTVHYSAAVVSSRCCFYELTQATNFTWRGSWRTSMWSMMEALWTGELGLFSAFTV